MDNIYFSYGQIMFVADFISGAIWFSFFNLILTRRYKPLPSFLIFLVWLLLTDGIVLALPYLSSVRALVALVIQCTACMIMFKNPKPVVFFSIIALYIAQTISELIAATTFLPEEFLIGHPELLSFKQLLISYSLMFATMILVFTLLYFIIKGILGGPSARAWLLFTLFPISQFLLMVSWLNTLTQLNKDERPASLLLVLFFCIIADIALYIAIKRMTQRERLAAENELLADQIDAQDAHYVELTTQYENIRHDIENHLNAMRGMLEAGQTEQAQEYIQELTAKPEDIARNICENPVVDSFLKNKIAKALEMNINVKPQISIKSALPVSNTDLIRAFGNMLDNSLEASEGLENAEVKVSAAVIKSHLVITTENAIPLAQREKRRKIPELGRGVGTRVLNDLAKRYDGNYAINNEGDICHTELILSIGAVN